MTHLDEPCEDVIDLSSEDEALPHVDIASNDVYAVGNHNFNPIFNHQIRTQEHAANFDIPLASGPIHATEYKFHDEENNFIVKDEFDTKNYGSAQGFPNTESYAQQTAPAPNNSFQSNFQHKEIARRFWKAGDYVPHFIENRTPPDGIDHVRVHPKFLHSNATSHKWALGAIAELLDNAIDEVQNGATYVKVDGINNPRDGSYMLLVQDDGGGMDPDNMRQCMSLGYSRKTNNNTIGQYGNGFKTSTMRLGADVIVFSRCIRNGYVTESVGLLSYTFLRLTGKEDIIVPMVDFELSVNTGARKMLLRTSKDDWLQNLHMILQWSPYRSEIELINQLADIQSHGTKVIIYNLWLNDDGELELDFDSDRKDIQLQGGYKRSRAESFPKQCTNQHISNRLRYSLRAYSSILYLRMPERFQIILRGEAVQHISIAADLKFPEQILYRPHVGSLKELGMGDVSVITTIGFVKEAPIINVHGFNVYHKNRLIMPFWKVFHENSSRGKGVVGVLEANFMEPAHDKQDFERTPVLQRLEGRLRSMTIEYWNLHCDLIGYQPPRYLAKTGINTSSSTCSEQKDTSKQYLYKQQTAVPAGTPNSSSQCDPFRYPISNHLRCSSVSAHQNDRSMADANASNDLRNPGISSSAPHPSADVERHWKHTDTTSDGCSNPVNSFQSDYSGSSPEMQATTKSSRVQEKLIGRQSLGKRAACQINLESDNPTSKRPASAMQEPVEGVVSSTVDSVPASQSTEDPSDNLKEFLQLKLRCKQYQFEKKQLEIKVKKLEEELLAAQYKLARYEAKSSANPRIEILD